MIDIATSLEQYQLAAKKKVMEYKMAAEANVVALLYKYPDLFEDYQLSIDSFHVSCWKIFFEIARRLFFVEGMRSFDDVSVGIYLEKHPKLKDKVMEYGGMETIRESFKYVTKENFDGYFKELNKWSKVLEMIQCGFPAYDRISDFTEMTNEEIYDEYEAMLNSIFSGSVENEDEAYDISEGIYDLIDDLDAGKAVGLPYHNMPILSAEVAGQLLGNVTLIGGLSNVGKSTFLRNAVIPSCIFNDERIVIMLNEEDLSRWQRELLVFVANNILNKKLSKKDVRNGNYTQETKDILVEAANWIVDKTKNNIITVIPFKKYLTSKVLKIIRKYSAAGVKYFALDTIKLDAEQVDETVWLTMQQNVVQISDLVKSSNKNVHISITFQLSKASTRQRFYMQDNIGLAKNMVDTASTCLMIRKVFEDEKSTGKRALEVRDQEGNLVMLEDDKNYQIVFIVKNREGSAGNFQIVVEHDLSRNILIERGITHVPQDF